ncbi:acetyltransferase (GNAT) family protein [Roseibium hamelinense]|uniref:Acetyltransferase (GNAT) family protein n=1 Tax=Roseibium hamelinense TaxID=150831 RepID=A0A562T9X4_9HYPH|nr:GNAT family N-acetyltransferase [Roseibium hamelinense]MTI45189.1 GNAT family N-acetyltransferase [Roseibium hamelinense]TWI90449.1 acetyltransferase (GNAT) family protein [Roseibium hamelinense]
MTKKEPLSLHIKKLFASDLEKEARELGAVLKACVEDGAGIGFVLPITQRAAADFWLEQKPGLETGSAHLVIVRSGARIAGTVMLMLAGKQNSQHRAEVAKLMVHPDFRRRGIARTLLAEAERLALELHRPLLVLDTVTGDTAEAMYEKLGYTRAGVIPKYAVSAHGGWDATTLFYKQLPG